MTKHHQSTEPKTGQETENHTNQAGARAAGQDAAAEDAAKHAATGGIGNEERTADEATMNAPASDDNRTEGSSPTDAISSERTTLLEKQLQDTEARLARAMADFDNFRRRTRQEHEELQKYASRKVVEGLLPVVDNFERALAAVDGQEVAGDLQKGVEMVYRQLLNLLNQQGVTAMEAVGKPFDPQVHEAVMQEPADGQESGIVLQELQKGYMLHDKVLRPAMVKVSV